MKKSTNVLLFSFSLLFMLTMITLSCSKKDGSDNNRPDPNTPPVITSITPAEVSVGQSITIHGTGLGNATVEIYKKLATVTAYTSTSITATVPAGIPTGQAAVDVTTAGGHVVSTVIIK